MATVQDNVRPMTDAESRDLIKKGISYSKMTLEQKRSWMKKLDANHEELAAKSAKMYDDYLGKAYDFDLPKSDDSDPPKTAKELLEKIRPRYEKGSKLDIMYQDLMNDDESVVDLIRRVRGSY